MHSVGHALYRGQGQSEYSKSADCRPKGRAGRNFRNSRTGGRKIRRTCPKYGRTKVV